MPLMRRDGEFGALADLCVGSRISVLVIGDTALRGGVVFLSGHVITGLSGDVMGRPAMFIQVGILVPRLSMPMAPVKAYNWCLWGIWADARQDTF